MPKIDQLVGATYRHLRMSFLDAFQGYHQIALAPEDQGKTTFISLDANYHYTVMPFGLKNVGAIYQWMMTRMFRNKIGRMVEVYIDDMCRKVSKKVGILRIYREHLKYFGNISCALTLRSVSSV